MFFLPNAISPSFSAGKFHRKFHNQLKGAYHTTTATLDPKTLHEMEGNPMMKPGAESDCPKACRPRLVAMMDANHPLK